MISAPLYRGEGNSIWALTVAAAAPRLWTRDDLHLVQDVGERTWAAIERARAEQAIRASEARLRQFGEASSDVLWIRDAGTLRWTYLRPAFEAIYGRARERVLGPDDWATWLDLIEPEDRAHAAGMIARVRAGERVTFEYRVRWSDGAVRWARNTDFPIRGADGAVCALGGTGRDITAEKAAAAALQALNATLEQRVRERTAERDALRRALAGAEEAERRRLARELHDQLGQHLTAFALALADARRRHEAGEPLGRQLTHLEGLARGMTRDARALALELRPPELDDVGLVSAVETYVREWGARTGIATELAVTGLPAHDVPAEAGSALYRILQEALTNVAKHAGASRVSVIVDQHDGQVGLIVEDDGRGFDPDAAAAHAGRGRRLGLAGMRERAALLGGTVAVESSPGAGTTLYARLPAGGEPAGQTHEGDGRGRGALMGQAR